MGTLPAVATAHGLQPQKWQDILLEQALALAVVPFATATACANKSRVHGKVADQFINRRVISPKSPIPQPKNEP